MNEQIRLVVNSTFLSIINDDCAKFSSRRLNRLASEYSHQLRFGKSYSNKLRQREALLIDELWKYHSGT